MARNKTTLLVRIELLLFAVIVFFFFIDLSSRKPFADLHVQVKRNNSLLNQKEVLLQSDSDVTSNNSLVLSDPLSTPHMSDFRWSGGGISGPTEGIENINLDTEIHKAVLQEFEAAIGVRAATFKAFNTSTEHSQQPNISAFVTFFTSKVATNTNPDCADRLHASHQLLCHVWAAQWQHNQSSDNSHQNNNNHSSVSSDDKDSSSSLFKDTALHSMCSLFLACAEWRCGRYSVPLSNALLQSTFESIVEDTALSNGSGVLLRNLIHGGSNWREYDWLADRVQTSRELLEGHTSPFDVRTVFQGGEITTKKNIDANGTVTQLFSSRDNGKTPHHLTRPLSALETIAVLHHRATSGKPQMVVFPRADSGATPVGAAECCVPAINVLLFSGDSIAHQQFIRLIDLVRHGPQGQVLVPYGTELLKSNFRHWPVHDRSRSRDMILAIYPTHDELLTFQSLLPYSVMDGAQFVRSNESVSAYFAAVAKQRATNLCNDSMKHASVVGNACKGANADNRSTPVEEEASRGALFYLVFLSDSITSRPRTDALAPCVPAAQSIVHEFPPKDVHNFQWLKEGVSRGLTLVHDPPVPSLRSLGVRIPMHVISANIWELHESPTTYEWLMRMATGNCNVTTAPLRGDEWRFGEHPTSDVTHLYRASTVLWVSPHARSRRRYSPNEFKEPSRRPALSAWPPTGPREVARVETPFRWLHDAVTNVTGSDPRNQTITRNSSHESERHRHGTFFSRLRVLDMGKVFLATDNVVHQQDGLHERCNGVYWLVGAASYSDSTRALRISAEALTREVFKILPEPHHIPDIERVPLRFDYSDDCDGFGTLVTLNALLLDIVQQQQAA